MGQKDSGWLSGMSDMLKGESEKRNHDRLKFNEMLGEPDLFVLDTENPFHDEAGTGYWRFEDGILTVRRPNIKYGFDPKTEEFLKGDWVLEMAKLLEKEPRVFD